MLTQPVDARALRRGHRGDRAHLPRRGRAHVLRRREPERRLRDRAARRHGLRRRAHQPAQDVLPARTAAAGPAAARSWCASILEPFLPSPQVVREDDGLPARRRPAEVDRPRARLHRPFGVFVRSYAYIRAYGPEASGDVRDGRAERELPARAAQGRLRAAVRPALHARVRALGARAQARARHHGARRREAAPWTTASTRRRSTSRSSCRRR